MIGSFVRNAPFGTEIAFAKGLREIGVQVNTWDPSSQNPHLDGSGVDATIVFKDHGKVTYPYLMYAKARGEINIEYQPDDVRAPGIRGMMEHMRQYCDYAFTFDKEGARVAKEELGYKEAKKLIVTADPDVYHQIKGMKKDLDFCFIGSLSNPIMHKSRNKMISLLTGAGYRVFAATIFDPVQINGLYNRSKVVLNHATDVGQDFGKGYGYQCRHFEAGMAGTCLFSNSLLDDEGDGLDCRVEFCDEENLLFWAEKLITMDEMRNEMAADQHKEIMSKHTPKHRAQEIVDFIEQVR